jgi:toxin secretion/phage lysis holin
MLDKIFQITAGGIGAICGALWGGLDGMLYVLLIFIALDYITGVIVAISHKKLSSEIGFKGVFKKATILILVAVATLIDKVLGNDGGAIRTATCFFYIANEGISLLENAGKLGIPLPKQLKNVLIQLKNKDTAEPQDEMIDP